RERARDRSPRQAGVGDLLRATSRPPASIRPAGARDGAGGRAVAPEPALGRVADHLPAPASSGPRPAGRGAFARARTTDGGGGHGRGETPAAGTAEHGEIAPEAIVADRRARCDAGLVQSTADRAG